MRDNRTNYVLVGAFVLAMVMALVVSIALISGRAGATDSYYAVYDNVSGLKYGAKVFFDGFAIGQVQDIKPQRSGGKVSFIVELAIKHGWPIPDDSVARIAASGLLAAVAVDIKGGASAILAKPGSQIRSQPGGNLFVAMADIASEVTALSQTGIRPLVEALNRTVSSFGPVIEKRAPELLDNLVALSADLAEKTPRISSNMERATKGLDRVFSDANTRKLNDAIDNADRTTANLAELTQSLHASKAKVDQVIGLLDKTVAGNSDNIDRSLRDLRYTMQAVASSIDSVTDNLDGTARNMNEFSRQIRQNPSLLLGGARPARETGPQ